MTVLDQAPVAGDAGGVTGERPERPDPQATYGDPWDGRGPGRRWWSRRTRAGDQSRGAGLL